MRLGLIGVHQAREVADEVRRGLELIELSPEQRERLTRDLAVDEAAIEQLAS